MHIPSERIYDEIRSEAASIWYVPANEGEDIAVLLKLPTPSIKALITGCSVRLIFGKKNGILCTGIRIFDMPDSPMYVSGIQRHEEEHVALNKILSLGTFPLFLFNEMDVCLAWTNAEICKNEAANITNFIGPINQLYVGKFTENSSHCLDCFDTTNDNTLNFQSAHKITTMELAPSFSDWTTINNSFVGHRAHHTITIDDKDEGEIFERAIWASLESVFPFTLYKSPQIKKGTNLRELTDILTFYENGSFLIEAKDLSVLKAGFERNQTRRTNGVQKQVKKAIKQLIGASNALASGKVVFDSNGEELDIERKQPPHCIILITELMHWGDWSDVTCQLMDAMEKTGAFFHLLDLREFITLLKCSSGQIELVDYNLIKRCELFIETKNIHIRSKPDPNHQINRTEDTSAT